MVLQLSRCTMLCAALFALPVAALTQAPVLLAKSATGESLYYSALDVAGTIKSVRTSLVYASTQTVGDLKNVLSSVSLEQIDCVRLTRSTTRVELFDNPDARGTPLWSKDFTAAEKPPLAIDTAASTASSILYRAVCLPTAVAQAAPPTAAPAVASASAPALPTPAASSPAATAQAKPASAPAQPQATANAAPPAPVPQPAPQNTANPPAKPVATAPAGGNAPTAAAPMQPSPPDTVVTGAMRDFRPVPGLKMTLGTMGKFAEYVYFNDEDFGFLVDTFAKIKRGRDQIAQDGKQHPLVDEAFRRIETRARRYNDKLQEKNAFLSVEQFKLLDLPKAQQGVVSGFRAELYQHVPTGEKILVFRGTDSALDWLSNLWTGIDLLAIEAPHYQAAYNLVSALRKRGEAPLVVGHSLGGGMAQYVGYKFGLKVVGFNSAPLPERYYQEGEGTKLDGIRLFSAVEFPIRPGPQPSPGYPDPVSIQVANGASYVNGLFSDYEPIKAHQLLTKPICVKSIPNPFYTEAEKEFHLAMANKALSKGMVSAVTGGILPRAKPIVADVAIVAEIKHMVNTGLSDPVWHPDSKSRRDTKIAQATRNEVVEVAVEQYKALGGTASVMKGGYKMAMSDTWGGLFSGMGTLAAAGAKVVAVETLIVRGMQPHSMERLNRGLRTVSAEDVFNAQPAAADCETTVSAKYP